MILVEINEDHYVIVDKTKDIQVNDKYLTSDNRIVNWHSEFDENIKENRPNPITHSTQPLETIVTENSFNNYEYISLDEIKELLGKVDVDSICQEEAKKLHDKGKHDDYSIYNELVYEDKETIKIGYNKAIENNKDKQYTEEQMFIMFMAGMGLKSAIEMKMIEDKPVGEIFNDLLERYKPKKKWRVEWEICETYKLDECNSRFHCCNKPKKLKLK